MSRPVHRRRRASAFVLVAGALAAAAFASAALAASFTLAVTKHAKVINQQHVTTHPNVVVNTNGMVLYTLSGDSKKHPECVKSNKCLQFWPPVTVSSLKRLSKASSIKGKLGTWKRLGFTQVTIDGHPLYTFSLDTKKGVATGEGIVHFGGTWHVRKAAPAGAATPTPGTGPGGY
jgi:predicted lipoprotein with Yx(FWY)xxD motif